MYIDSAGTVFLGKIKYEGPYCENEALISNYDSSNGALIQKIADVEGMICDNEPPKVKRLIRIGDEYKCSSLEE